MGVQTAKRQFTARLSCEGDWVVAQCLEVDVASQGRTEEKALANLKEALTLHFEPPTASKAPSIHAVEIDVGAAKVVASVSKHTGGVLRR